MEEALAEGLQTRKWAMTHQKVSVLQGLSRGYEGKSQGFNRKRETIRHKQEQTGMAALSCMSLQRLGLGFRHQASAELTRACRSNRDRSVKRSVRKSELYIIYIQAGEELPSVFLCIST